MKTGAKILVESLQREGVETIFGYPGGQILPVYDELYDSSLRHILVRHEQAAAHAAGGCGKKPDRRWRRHNVVPGHARDSKIRYRRAIARAAGGRDKSADRRPAGVSDIPFLSGLTDQPPAKSASGLSRPGRPRYDRQPRPALRAAWPMQTRIGSEESGRLLPARDRAPRHMYARPRNR